MHQRISKKILVYLFIFFLVGTFNNKKISEFKIPKINNYEIIGLQELDDKKIDEDLDFLKKFDVFFLQKDEIFQIINSNKLVEKFSIYKNYPSSLIINVQETKFLAYTKINGLDYYIGSNGNFINTKDELIDLPFIFGDFEIDEFFKLKKIIDKSNFDYNKIKVLYYFKSKRWDIETKDNLIIKLPIKNLENSLKTFLEIYKKDEFIEFDIIDLRLDNQVILNG